MAKTAYSKAELDEMMAEATAAVELLVKNEVAGLQKNAEIQSAEDKKAQGGQMNKAGEDPSSPPPDASASAPAPDASAPPADASAGAPPASPDPAMGAQDPAAAAAGGAPSMEELVSAYSQLSPDELKLHMQALQQVVMAASSAAPPAAPGASPAASASAPASPPPGPDATAPLPADQSQGVNPEFAMKAENLQGQVDDLKKSLNMAVDALTMVLNQPKVKSITGDDVILKSEPSINLASLTKSQINERLNKTIRGGKLEKSDGELIKGFFNGQKQVADIAHLLK